MPTSETSELAKPVVVGVDGSTSSLMAVDLAAREAVLRRRPLRVVHAFIWPYLHVPLEPSPLGPPEAGLGKEAQRIVARALDRARATAPETAMTGEVIVGSAAPVLLECARSAALVVVGDSGLGAFSGLLLGSVAIHLTAHAHCPVLVARGTVDPTRPVLLGVDGSPSSAPAVGFAFEEAALRGVRLDALHVWTHPSSVGYDDAGYDYGRYEDDEMKGEESRVLAEALAGWADKYPDVVVQRAVLRGGTRKTLIDATSAAQLVVVGSRGRGGFAGLLLGSVSQAVLHHAACPVAILPHSRATR